MQPEPGSYSYPDKDTEANVYVHSAAASRGRNGDTHRGAYEAGCQQHADRHRHRRSHPHTRSTYRCATSGGAASSGASYANDCAHRNLHAWVPHTHWDASGLVPGR